MARALILTGYGINCDDETAYAFSRAGAETSAVHVNDLIEGKKRLADFDILAFPGGFSYGDDTGSGNAMASKIRHNLWGDLERFIAEEKIVLGICNGFQVLTRLGLLPALEGTTGERSAALTWNTRPRYQCRWVELAAGGNGNGKCVFTKGMESLRAPIAHGEGRFTASEEVLDGMERDGQVVFRYAREGKAAGGAFPHNPNGSARDIAAVCDPTGRILGMMPHPERNLFTVQQPDWTLQRERLRREGKRLPDTGDGARIFENAVRHFT